MSGREIIVHCTGNSLRCELLICIQKRGVRYTAGLRENRNIIRCAEPRHPDEISDQLRWTITTTDDKQFAFCAGCSNWCSIFLPASWA